MQSIKERSPSPSAMACSLQPEVLSSAFQAHLACRYAASRPLQRKLWHTCVARPVRPYQQRKAKCSLDDDVINQPIEPPQYYTFRDPISGELGPAYSQNRNTMPDEPFWSADMPGIVRRSTATRPQKASSKLKGGMPGSRRRTSLNVKPAPSPQQTVQVYDFNEEEDEDEYRDKYVTYKDPNEKEPEKPKDVKQMKLEPLPDEKLWFNWRKLPPGEEPWTEFSRPPTDPFAVMATVAAKRGQIKLFSDKPTVTEAVLARARKDALMQERLDMEAKRQEEIGGMAYYSEWVKAWKKDTSKQAVQEHFEETGEDESVQLLDMFAHQTLEEYRIMMGTDYRIRRDPLCIRMTPEEKKAVWGGDPVYPTINYYQDPYAKADYRGPNMHEPSENLLESLRKAGRIMSKEKLKEIRDREAASQTAMEKDFEEAIAGAVDIGEKEEDEEEKGGEEERQVEEGEAKEEENRENDEEDGEEDQSEEEDDKQDEKFEETKNEANEDDDLLNATKQKLEED